MSKLTLFPTITCAASRTGKCHGTTCFTINLLCDVPHLRMAIHDVRHWGQVTADRDDLFLKRKEKNERVSINNLSYKLKIIFTTIFYT